ncbi:MAG: PINc/VapC family ATPase [Candidatus Micrarchaeota archaeon]
MKTVVPDTSVVIDGRITQMVRSGKFKGHRIVLPNSVLAELEHQANRNKETGFSGLSEIKALHEIAQAGEITLEFSGERPSFEEIRGAKKGDIDARIRKLAKELDAIFVTSDKVQGEVAMAEGIDVVYLEPHFVEKELPFIKMFGADTLSVHLKEDTIPLAKVGSPGNVTLVKLAEKKTKRDEIKEMAKDIIEAAKRGGTDTYIEIDRKGATVIQLREYRIALTRPPFSDGIEITIVRPIYKAALSDYELSDKLRERLSDRAEGVIICGPPGAGKSTFTAALAEFYLAKGKIVKTMESPRDLQVVSEITQYAPLEGSFEKTSDIILLTRPDYTVYDEMRKTDDFVIYADLRLAGIGMVGVLHANQPIDAIQRFIGRVDLGLIPQLVDTIVFIKGGKVEKVYEQSFLVKVPTGMVEQDLARPVIEVRDFETGSLEYEIYKFGEETVVLPIIAQAAHAKIDKKDLEKRLYRAISKHVRDFQIDVSGGRAVVYVHSKDMSRLIGRKGETISGIEHKVGAKIDLKAID